MKKLINLIKYWLGIKPKWNECTKSSNWFGVNANHRVMNILSPLMSETRFNERVAEAKERGVNCFHLILVNKADGECAGYTALDQVSAKVMDKRIEKLRKDGYGIVLWCMTDDSKEWSRMLDMPALMKVCKQHGWLKQASTVVVGLETDEYWSAAEVASHIAVIRQYYDGKVGVHMTSGKTSFAPFADILFYQTEPGKNPAQIKAEAVKALQCGKPVNFFELSRHEDRALCQVALAAGCYGVGNW